MELNLTNYEQKILKKSQQYRNDPVAFAQALGPPLWEKEIDILNALKDNREVAVRSCNASGKTFTAARAVHWWLLNYPDSIVITTAPTGRQVREVLWREIKQAITGKGIYRPEEVLETKINLNPKWFALGLSTDEPDQFQGFHAPYLLAIIDEASGVPDIIFEAIDGLKPNKILYIGNPLRNEGRFAKIFTEPNVEKIHVSAFDTPNVKVGSIVIPGLITLEDIEKFKQRYGEDSDVYRVRVLGEFPRAGIDTFISVDEVARAIQREVMPSSQLEKVLGVDIARYGEDRTVFLIRQFYQVLKKEVMSKTDTMQIVGKIIALAKDEYIRAENIFIDGTGIGAGVVDRLREQAWNVNDINTGSPAEDVDHYGNLRAELGGKVKEWLLKGQLLKDDDFYEMANIKYKFNSKGQILLESKEDMKKRGLPSPDTFDALCLTFAKGKVMQLGQMKATESLKPYYPELGV